MKEISKNIKKHQKTSKNIKKYLNYASRHRREHL